MNKTLFTIGVLLSPLFSFSQVSIYDNLTDFESANSGELIFEDFTSAINEPAICGTIVNSETQNDCFNQGDLVAGFSLNASNDSELVSLPIGFLPSDNLTPRLGANAGVESTIISFDNNPHAVGFSLFTDSDNPFNIRVYSVDDVLLYESEISYSSFIGISSTESVSRVELDAINGTGELIGDLRFGNGEMASIEQNSAQISYYPNPVNHVLHINSDEKILQFEMLDFTGKKIPFTVTKKNKNSEIDFSHLNKGIYLVQIQTAKGVQSFQIVKK